MDYTQPVSDENSAVMDTTFSDIPVRLYLPKEERKPETSCNLYSWVVPLSWGSYSSDFYISKCVWVYVFVCICTL